ncbi:MAG: redoxin family protein, partial [Dehalococcoidia bacterium]|nr:redoxin family protein [Dehalococcoidia bacterium]
GWSIPPSTRQLLLRGFWAAVFLAIAGLGSYYAVTKIGNVSLPSTSTANPITIPIPPPAPAQTYTLATNVNPEAAGQVSPSPENETYTSGSEVTLTATPAGGYTFGHWGGDVSGSSATIHAIMDSDKTVTAYFRDTTPPEIRNVEVSRKTDVTATVTWTTDDPATSQVEYGTTRDYGHPAPSHEELEKEHEVRIPGLQPDTKYYFRVKSINESGIEAVSHRDMFHTLRAIPVGHEVGKRAPEFALLEYNDVNDRESPNKGNAVDLGKFLGNRKILLDFWSTGCSACLAQFPLIREIYYGDKCKQNAHNADVAVFTVCIDGERTDRIQKLIDKYSDPEKFGPFNFPILLDKEGMTTTDVYNIWRIPKTVFIDSDGIIREIKIGRFHSKEEIESILDSL